MKSGALKAVRIGEGEYEAMKALAQRNGQFITFLLNQAIQQYLDRIRDNARRYEAERAK